VILGFRNGQPFLHITLGAEIVAMDTDEFRSRMSFCWNRMSFFPARFHYYFSTYLGDMPELSVPAGSVVEWLAMPGGNMRRRLGRDEIAKLAGGVAVPESPAAAELDRRVYRVFDPEGIMLP
jgi:hypothetical protein